MIVFTPRSNIIWTGLQFSDNAYLLFMCQQTKDLHISWSTDFQLCFTSACRGGVAL